MQRCHVIFAISQTISMPLERGKTHTGELIEFWQSLQAHRLARNPKSRNI